MSVDCLSPWCHPSVGVWLTRKLFPRTVKVQLSTQMHTDATEIWERQGVGRFSVTEKGCTLVRMMWLSDNPQPQCGTELLLCRTLSVSLTCFIMRHQSVRTCKSGSGGGGIPECCHVPQLATQVTLNSAHSIIIVTSLILVFFFFFIILFIMFKNWSFDFFCEIWWKCWCCRFFFSEVRSIWLKVSLWWKNCLIWIFYEVAAFVTMCPKCSNSYT